MKKRLYQWVDGLARIWKMSDSKVALAIKTVESAIYTAKTLFGYHSVRAFFDDRGYSTVLEAEAPFVLQILQSEEVPYEVLYHQKASDDAPWEVRRFHLTKDFSITMACWMYQTTTEYWMHPQSKETEEVVRDKFRSWFWDQFSQRAVVRKTRTPTGWVPRITTLDEKTRNYIGPYDLEYFLNYWDKFKKAGFSRCLLFLGPPGTGKTSMSHNIAFSDPDGTLLHLGANVLGGLWDTSMVVTVYQLLKPTVLLMDDIHGIPSDDIGEILFLLEWINESANPEALVIGTANKIEVVDEALRRPGRFDCTFEFSAPDSEEWVEEVFRFYAEKFNCVAEVENMLPKLIKLTKGITPAYLMELTKTISSLRDEPDLEEFIRTQCTLMNSLIHAQFGDDKQMLERGGLSKKKKKSEGIGFTPQPDRVRTSLGDDSR